MTVYLDLVMLLNFLVDFLLLQGTNRLCGFPPKLRRALPAALLGAVYSGGCLLPGFHFLGNGLWRLVSLTLMGAIAFGWNSGALRRSVIFVLLSMALGGMALGFGGGNFGTLLLSAAGVWALCRFGFGGSPGQAYVPVSIPWEGGKLEFYALRDTGNTLRDPITGESVLVIGGDAAETLTGLTRRQLSDPVETVTENAGYRLIPYRAVGCSGGMLLMKRFPDMTLGDRRGSFLVAFSPEAIGKSEGYQALAGGMV